MYIRKSGEIRKDFKIEELERKMDVINTELDALCADIIISLNKNEPVDLKDVENQIREIQSFIEN